MTEVGVVGVRSDLVVGDGEPGGPDVAGDIAGVGGADHGAPLAREPTTVQARHLHAVVALALSSALIMASCLQSPTAAPETDPGQVQCSDGPEPTGQAQEESGAAFSPDEFSFVVVVKDNGKGKGGGWQAAEKTFSFVERNWGIPVYSWECRLSIEMPLRCAVEGPITSSRAALYAAVVANAVVDPLLESRSAWTGQGGEFCRELKEEMLSMFKCSHPGLGARVNLNP